MFRHRETDQKPDEELIDTFKKTFPDVISGVSASGIPSNLATVNSSALKQTMNNRAISDDDLKINDPTPCTLQDIRYTSSLLDPSSFSFMSLTNQATEYYAPVTSGMSTAYPQAESLHTSALGVSLVPPLAIPNTLSGTLPSDPVPDITMSEFQNPFISQPFPSLNAFAQQSSYAPPSEFIQRESTYNPLDNSLENQTDPADIALNSSLGVVTPKASLADHMDVGSATYGDTFRFRAILRAPTAMVRNANEIPVTYLNKGQAYSISVVDTNPPGLSASNLRYRTFIRVSFEDEEQRSKPAACWQLWRDGRGSNEAHQRGGKLLAVEYVDPAPGGDGKHELPQIELEAASFDGFCVNWSPNPNTRSPDCAISVRFNFLSTDFSHSKGVKGIPVRLCAKTEIVSPGNDTHALTTTEVCYCKVKLFRDHGAERKLSNDIAHVKKTIDKLKQRIAQQDVCGGNFGKRKRSQSSIPAGSGESRPAKIPKHKRTRSTDSSNDGAGKPPPEEDLHLKLAMMQDMFSSTRPVSVLNLAGEDRDDPDLFPVSLPGSSGNIKLEPLSNQTTQESFRSSMDTTSGASYILSPSDSSVSSSEHSIVNHHIRKEEVTDWTGSGAQHSLLTQPLKIHRVPRKGGPLSTGYIEAADIDPTYRPPAECPPKPIACFYVRFPNEQPGDSYYRAVYLSERTVRDFMRKISEKRKIDPDRIGRILRVHSNGLKIAVDDDVVKQLPDEQDMVIEFAEAPNSSCATPDVNTPTSAVEVTLTY